MQVSPSQQATGGDSAEAREALQVPPAASWAVVGQQRVPLSQPLLLREPSGMTALQKMAPPRLTELPSVAPTQADVDKTAAAQVGAAEVGSAQIGAREVDSLLRFEPRTSRSKKAVEPEKSQPEVFLPLPGVQVVPG